MTEEKSKEQIEKEKAAKELKETRISNLKTLAIYEGARYLKSNESPYGVEGMVAGSQAYGQFLMGDKAKEIRNNVYKSKLEQAANSGTIAQPEVSNFDMEQNALGLIQDAKSGLNLGDLEKIVGEIAPGYLTFKIPEKLKGKNYGKIEKKIQEEEMKLQKELIEYQKSAEGEITQDKLQKKLEELKAKAYKLTEEEKEITELNKALEFAYTDGAANFLQRQHKMAKFNQVGKEIEEKYNPKEEPKKDSE